MALNFLNLLQLKIIHWRKVLDFFKTKIGKSSMQGEEIVGVELNNKKYKTG